MNLKSEVIELRSITRLLRQMAWTWIGYLVFIVIFGLVWIKSSPELIQWMGVTKTYMYFSLFAPLCGWSLVSLHMFKVARGLENDFEIWERRAKTIAYVAGILLGPPLLSYQAWHLLKKLKQYGIQSREID